MANDSSFLGSGWSFPPSFSRGLASVEMASGVEDIRESLWILFSTTLGERIMLPNYGCAIWQTVFRGITTTLLSELEDNVATAILYWEPRINVDRVSAEPEATLDGVVSITVEFTIRTTNTRSNLVYPFYIQEATIPAQTP